MRSQVSPPQVLEAEAGANQVLVWTRPGNSVRVKDPGTDLSAGTADDHLRSSTAEPQATQDVAVPLSEALRSGDWIFAETESGARSSVMLSAVVRVPQTVDSDPARRTTLVLPLLVLATATLMRSRKLANHE